MHADAESLFLRLRDFLESFQIPYGFVFGNHDNESFLPKKGLAHIIMKSSLCLFEKGNLSEGVGNYHVDIVHQGKLIFRLILLDSHNDRIDLIDGQKQWSYDYLKPSQLDYVSSLLKKDNAKSLLFFHIPIPEFAEKIEFQGVQNEAVCSSKINSGLFDLLKTHKNALGVFCGHDHYNDYSFKKEGILLAYGRVSGYYDYQDIPFARGARKIELFDNGTIETSVILERKKS